MSTRLAFLLGIVTGVAISIVIGVAGLIVLLQALAPKTALESLQKYRGAASIAAVDDAEKEPVLKRLDAVTEHIHAHKIGFLDMAQMQEKLDPAVKDCQITPDEWPGFARELKAAAQVLGVTLKD